MKKYDVVATTGTYEKDGQKKYINKNVGAILETKHGLRLVLDASFNPAGCHERTEDGKVFLALFEPQDNNQQQAPQQQQNNQQQYAQQTGGAPQQQYGGNAPNF